MHECQMQQALLVQEGSRKVSKDPHKMLKFNSKKYQSGESFEKLFIVWQMFLFFFVFFSVYRERETQIVQNE